MYHGPMKSDEIYEKIIYNISDRVRYDIMRTGMR